MLTETELLRRMRAMVETNADKLPMTTQTAVFVVKLLAPHILDVIREAVADAKRDWNARLERQL